MMDWFIMVIDCGLIIVFGKWWWWQWFICHQKGKCGRVRQCTFNIRSIGLQILGSEKLKIWWLPSEALFIG